MIARTMTVVTPVYNSRRLIERTLESLKSQALELRGRNIELQYVVVDGGSSDGTLDAVRSAGIEWMEIISEPDKGMYDALAKGLLKARGDLVCYLNAGDMFLPSALRTVAAIADDVDTDWFTCASLHYCDERMITRADMPYRFRRSLVRAGAYGRILPFIQQESTFWRRSILDAVDFDRLRTFRLAGDYFLWWSFAARTDLDVVHTAVSGFSINEGQLSEAKERYFAEMETIAGPIPLRTRVTAKMEKFGWRASPSRRLEMNAAAIRYDHGLKRWGRG